MLNVVEGASGRTRPILGKSVRKTDVAKKTADSFANCGYNPGSNLAIEWRAFWGASPLGSVQCTT